MTAVELVVTIWLTSLTIFWIGNFILSITLVRAQHRLLGTYRELVRLKSIKHARVIERLGTLVESLGVVITELEKGSLDNDTVKITFFIMENQRQDLFTEYRLAQYELKARKEQTVATNEEEYLLECTRVHSKEE